MAEKNGKKEKEVKPKKEKEAPKKSMRRYMSIKVGMQIDRIYGGIPMDPEAILKTEEAIGPHPEGETAAERIQAVTTIPNAAKVSLEEADPAAPPATETGDEPELPPTFGKTGFRRDENGFYVRDFMLKQMLKEAATALKVTTEKRGSKTILTIGFRVNEKKVYLMHLTHVVAPSDVEEIRGQVRTMQGRRQVINLKEAVDNCRIDFTLSFLDDGIVTFQDLYDLFYHSGAYVGLGAARSRGGGRFEVDRFEFAGYETSADHMPKSFIPPPKDLRTPLTGE